jgi:autotransporter-associated beta strand protein
VLCPSRVFGTAALLGTLLSAAPLQAADSLIGRWISGPANLTDSSGFTASGTHNGVAVGANAASLAWSVDVPTGFPPGNSLDLTANNVAVQINNTATDDAAYQTTFDNGISTKFTGAFWFKGTAPGNLAGAWLCKSGNTPLGWQSRTLNNPTTVDFTMRSNSGESVASSMHSGPTAYTDGAWHHVAIVFDGTASFRKLYVDGVEKKSVTGTPYSVNFSAASHLVIGGNQGNTAGAAISNFFPGKMYDVRMYNYALTASQVSDIFNPPALPSSKEITSFTFPGIGNATILGNNISITVPFSTNVEALAPTYVHTGASSSPASGSTQNFNTPRTYTITAGNASTSNYLVTVTKAPVSSACDILSLTLGSYSTSIVGTSITLYVPPGTDVTNLSPTFTLSPFATASPPSGSARDFTNPANYVVTAEDGAATKTYSVTVAETNFWITKVNDETWTTAADWNPAVVPTSAATTVLGFFTPGTYASTHDLGDDFEVNQLVFGAPVVRLDGQSLLFSGTAPAIVQSGTAAVTVSNNLNLGTGTSIGGSGTGSVSLSGVISGGSLTKLTPGNLTLSRANSYSGGTIISRGMLTVAAQTALGSGPVTLAGGTSLQQINFEGFGVTGVLGNNFTLSGGLVNLAFEFNNTKDITLVGVVSGAGGFHLSGAQRGLALSGDNTFSGGVIVDAATDGVVIAANHINGLGTGPLSLGAGTRARLNYVGDHTLPSLTLSGVVQPKGTYGSTASGASTVDDTHFLGAGTVTVGPKMLTFDFGIYGLGVITDNAIAVTVPFGTDVTSLDPTYTTSFGATGDLASGSSQNFNSPQTYTLTSGIHTEAYVVTVTIASDIPPTIFSWITSGPGDWSDGANWTTNVGIGFAPSTTGQADYVFNFNQTGTYIARQDQDSGYILNKINFGGSAVTLNGGDLALTANGLLMPQLNQNSASGITVATRLALTANTTLGGTGGGAVTITGIVSGTGSLTKTTSGTLTLSGVNTYAGGTAINSGTLSVGAQTALGSGVVTLAAGTNLQQVNFEGFGAGSTLANNFILSGGLVNMAFNFGTTKDMTIGGIVSGSGGFHLSGAQRSLILAGNNTFTGGISVDAATDGVVIAANHINGLGTGPLSLGAGTRAQLNYSGDHVLPSLTLNGVIQPNGTYGSTASGASTIDNAHFAGIGTVTVGPHQQAKILSFTVVGSSATVIDQGNLTIRVTVPSGTDVTNLAPLYTVSPRATSTPASGVARDFSTPKTYSVTSEDTLTTQVYSVTVVRGTAPVATVSGITGPVAGPGVGEFTVTITGSTDTAGNVGVEMSTDLRIWNLVKTSPVLGGSFSLPVTIVGTEPKAFFRLSGQ